MAEIIKKIANAGKIYSIGGGSTPVEEVEHKVVTQEEFDVIPQEEKVKNVYMIKGEAEPTPTPTPDERWLVERGDVILWTVSFPCDVEWYYITNVTWNWGRIRPYTNSGLYPNTYQTATDSSARYIYDWVLYMATANGSKDLYIFDIKTYFSKQVYVGTAIYETRNTIKINNNWWFYQYGDYYKVSYDRATWEVTTNKITQEEYDEQKNYANSINWLFYSQNGADYVAKDIDGNVVKTYENVWTITGIANGKLYRAVNGVSYAICWL